MLNRRPLRDAGAQGELARKKLMIQFICPKCNRDLAWAYENSDVYCRVCDRWVRAVDLKRTNPAKIDPDQNQLILF